MRFWIGLSLGLLSACQFADGLPYGARVPCAVDRECPTGNQCDEEFLLCVASSSPFTITMPLQPAKGRIGEVFRVGLASAELSPSELAVVALDHAGLVVGTFNFNEERGAWSWAATGEEPEGRLRVFVSAREHSRIGAVNLVALGVIELDFTPPLASEAQVRVLPTEDNPLVATGYPALVTAGRPGAEVETTFQLSEEVQGLPLVTAGEGNSRLVLSVTNAGSIYRAVATLPADIVAGPLAFRMEAADQVGNRATIDLGTLSVLSAAPPPPDVGAPGLVQFHRAPWGTLDSPSPSWRLTGAPGAALGTVAVVVVAGPFTIGRGTVSADGHFEAKLTLAGDVPSVSVRAFDAAGNPSTLVEVLEIEWTISALAADAGVRRQTGAYAPWRGAWQPARVLPPGAPWRATGDFVFSRPNSGAPQRLVATRAGLLGDSPLWIEGREVVGRLSDSYSLNCVAPRSLRIDLERNRPYCFGRAAGLSLADGGTFTDERFEGEEAWVPPERRVLALGGLVNGEPAAGGFWYDGAEVSLLEGPLPPPRSRHAMVWDSARERLLVFGGRDADGGVLDDTWAWADGGFFPLTQSVPQPRGRAGATLAWDSLQQRVVMAGGLLADGSPAADTWVHDGVAWRELDAGAYPPRFAGSMGQSSTPGLLVWAGGSSVDGGVPGNALLRNGRWSAFSQGSSWGYCVAPTLGFHPQLGVIAVGGASTDESCGESDCSYYLRVQDRPMRLWRDWGWVELADAGQPLTTGGKLAWDRSTGELVLSQGMVWADAGGEIDGTLFALDWRQQHRWSLDGGWAVRSLPAAGAPDLSSPATLYDEAGARLLVHGGYQPDGGTSRNTWELGPDGQWRFLEIGPSIYPWAAYQWEADRLGGASVLTSYSGTWRFDGRWVSAPTVQGRFTRHPLTSELMSVEYGAIWVLSQGTWQRTPMPELGSVPGHARIELEADTGRLIIAGSDDYNSGTEGTRVLDFRAGQPAQEFLPPLAAIVGPGDEVFGASMRARGVGLSPLPDGGPGDGLQLLYRFEGALQPVAGARCAADVASGLTRCDADLIDRALLRRWLRRDAAVQTDVSIGLTTLGPNGAGQALLQTNGLELSVVIRRDGGLP